MSLTRSHPDWLAGIAQTKPVFNASSSLNTDGTRLISDGASSSAPAKHPEAPLTLGQQVVAEGKAFFLDTKLNFGLLALPFAIVSKAVGWGDAATFILSMISLCPLAERLGFITEQLAMYTNDTLGGLLNASFGNATEVIISGFALQKGYLRIVQLSLLGSVVSNLLLVMGTAFIAGGIRTNTQRFNQQSINVNCALLLLSVLIVLLPSLLSETGTESKAGHSELGLSRFESIFMLLCYGLYLVFQLWTHRHLYEEGGNEGKDTKSAAEQQPLTWSRGDVDLAEANKATLDGAGTRGHDPADISRISNNGVAVLRRFGSRGRTSNNVDIELGSRRLLEDEITPDASITDKGAKIGGVIAVMSPTTRGSKAGGSDDVGPEAGDAGGDDDEEEEQVLSKVGCFVWLTLVTILIALLSEWIMGAIEGAARSLRVPMPFLVTILLPIVGNAAEHASAIVFAYKNRMEIALGVAVGSATQVGVLIVPFCVILAWCMGKPLDLNFNAFECSVYFASVLLAVITVIDGSSNWLKGVLLLLTYVFVSAGFWWHKDLYLERENE